MLALSRESSQQSIKLVITNGPHWACVVHSVFICTCRANSVLVSDRADDDMCRPTSAMILAASIYGLSLTAVNIFVFIRCHIRVYKRAVLAFWQLDPLWLMA